MFLMAAAIAYRYSHLSKGNDAQHWMKACHKWVIGTVQIRYINPRGHRYQTRVTLEYGLFFLNCYEWCKFPFTQWSVDIILSKEPVIYFFHTRELYSVRCKMCKHTRQKKLRFSEVKKKAVIFTFIADRFYTRLKIMTINKYKCDF
jgi:hypothetical protein